MVRKTIFGEGFYQAYALYDYEVGSKKDVSQILLKPIIIIIYKKAWSSIYKDESESTRSLHLVFVDAMADLGINIQSPIPQNIFSDVALFSPSPRNYFPEFVFISGFVFVDAVPDLGSMINLQSPTGWYWDISQNLFSHAPMNLILRVDLL